MNLEASLAASQLLHRFFVYQSYVGEDTYVIGRQEVSLSAFFGVLSLSLE